MHTTNILSSSDVAILQSSHWINDSTTMSVLFLLKKQSSGSLFGWQSTELAKRKIIFNQLPPIMLLIQVLHVNVITESQHPTSNLTLVKHIPIPFVCMTAIGLKKSTVSLVTMQQICSFLSKMRPTSILILWMWKDSPMVQSVFMCLPLLQSWHMAEILSFTWDEDNMRGYSSWGVYKLDLCYHLLERVKWKIGFGKRIRVSHAESLSVLAGCIKKYIDCSWCRGWFHVALSTHISYRNMKWNCPNCKQIMNRMSAK